MGMKKLKTTFWLSAACMCLMSLSFLVMPIASDKAIRGENWWMIFSGLLFWVPLIGGYLLLYIASRWRKRHRNYLRQHGGIKSWGMFRIASNIYACLADMVSILSLIGFIIFFIFNSESYGTYILLSMTILTFHMHGMLNGANYKAVYDTRANSHRRKQEGKANG